MAAVRRTNAITGDTTAETPINPTSTARTVSAQNRLTTVSTTPARRRSDMAYRSFCALALLVAVATGGADAREEARPFPGGRTAALESCVGGSPIQFRPDDRRVWLEAVDTAAVASALTRRYPMLDRDGLLPDA